MCWMCNEFGDPEHGNGLWYLNPKNYARNMYKLRAPGEGFKGAEAGLETGARSGPSQMDLLNAIENNDRAEYDRITSIMMARGQGSQIVALEDADKVLELSSPIGLIACICRKGIRAIDERNEHEYTCMGMGVGMLKWERWPERYKGGVAFVNLDEAKEWNHEMDRRGFVHILMLFGAPFIGGFCQCDYPDCGAVRNAVDFGLGSLKGHHVAMVDYDKCNGCGICAQRCQWGALKFEVTTEKANVDIFKCYGCGLCQTGCPRGAIKLEPRVNVPAVAEVWT
ncbi:MAG: 4Fe-4S binding protein [Dehalococcoidales bacterium]|nr:MAG: 4Fe-4S binding protein [Dehalococcoidales bacterium]